jgi:hypothetical protein
LSNSFPLDPNHKLVVLTLPKDQLKNYVTQLPKLMTHLKQITGKIFAPFSLQSNPLDPGKELMIMMRPANLIDKFFYGQDFPIDENLIAKRFTVRVF